VHFVVNSRAGPGQSAKILAWLFGQGSEVTYNVSSGTLNFTYSLTHSLAKANPLRPRSKTIISLTQSHIINMVKVTKSLQTSKEGIDSKSSARNPFQAEIASRVRWVQNYLMAYSHIMQLFTADDRFSRPLSLFKYREFSSICFKSLSPNVIACTE